MAKRIYLKYTSMKCLAETDDWSTADEPYAIFVATHGSPHSSKWYRVSYTKTYTDVDAGENRGTNDGSDNVYLIRKSDGRTLDHGNPTLFLFMMEKDWGDKGYIVQSLENHLKGYGGEQWPPAILSLCDVVKRAIENHDSPDPDELLWSLAWTPDFSKLGSDGYGRKTFTRRGDGGRYRLRFSLYYRDVT